MKGKNNRIFWFHSSYVLWETAKIVIKEQLKQENQRKLFEKLLFITIRPEFNNSRLLRSFSSSLIAFSVVSFRWFRFGVPAGVLVYAQGEQLIKPGGGVLDPCLGRGVPLRV